MKKTLTLILPLLSMWLMAQTHRFTYEYRYIPDINEKEKVITDQMALDISPTGSRYHSLEKIAMDSILQALIKSMEKTGNLKIDMRGTGKPGMADYKVDKEYPNYKVFLTRRVDRDLYKIAEEKKNHLENRTRNPENWDIRSPKGHHQFRRQKLGWPGLPKTCPFQMVPTNSTACQA